MDWHVAYHTIKPDYPELSGAWIQAACGETKRFYDQPNVVFGGQKLWNEVASGKATKEQWINVRNNQLYGSGDTGACGNRFIRIEADRILINRPDVISGKNKWMVGKLWIPKKFQPKFLASLKKYDVRLIRKPSGQWEVKIGWEDSKQQGLFPDISNGVIGLDCNPDGVALVEVNKQGHLLKHLYEQNTRIRDAQFGKRDADVREMAKRIVEYAQVAKKPLVIEKLSFKAKSGWRKFNRMRHNFVYRKLVEAIKSRALRCDVGVIEVDPAYTSQLGILKYQKMYSLNRHTAAALVIARRGMFIKERQDFKVEETQPENSRGTRRVGSKRKQASVNLAGRGSTVVLTQKSWSYFQSCFLRVNPAHLTGAQLSSGAHSAISCSSGAIPLGETLTTDRSLADPFGLAIRGMRLPSSGAAHDG